MVKNEQMIYQVAIKKSSEGFNLLSLTEFIEMELGARTELILAGKVQFLNEFGDMIPLLDAVRILKS